VSLGGKQTWGRPLPAGLPTAASSQVGIRAMTDTEQAESQTVAPLPTLAHLPEGVTPGCGGSWGAAISNGGISRACWSLACRAVLGISTIALVVVILRPVPIQDPPQLDYRIDGHNALHGLLSMPKQFNRTQAWGFQKSPPQPPGKVLHVAMLLAHANQEFPSLYEGAPAEPRLSEKGMLDAYNLGAAVRKQLLAEGLLQKEPSALEATAQSIADGRAIDTANAFLLGLLPIHVKEMWRQSTSRADCHCREEPYDIPFNLETPKPEWRMNADVLSRHSTTKVPCLASCMGLNVHVSTGNAASSDVLQVQPVPVKVEEPAKDVVLRQFSACKSARVDITKEIAGDRFHYEETHKYADLLNSIRSVVNQHLFNSLTSCLAAQTRKPSRQDCMSAHTETPLQLPHIHIYSATSPGHGNTATALSRRPVAA